MGLCPTLEVLPGARGGPLGAHCRAFHAWQAVGISASQSWQVETTYNSAWPQPSSETRHTSWPHEVAGICLLIGPGTFHGQVATWVASVRADPLQAVCAFALLSILHILHF